MTLNNVTIAANTADSDNNGDGGGGVYKTNVGSMTVQNSLIAVNFDLSGGSPDCLAETNDIVSDGYNLIGAADGCNWTSATGDQIGTRGLAHRPGPGCPANERHNLGASSADRQPGHQRGQPGHTGQRRRGL